MAGRITMDGLEPNSPSVPHRVRARSAPGEFTLAAVVWAFLAFYPVYSGFAQDQVALTIVEAVAMAVLVIGIAWPVIVMRSVRLAVVAPSDVVVGQQIQYQVTTSGRAHNLWIRLEPSGVWHHVSAPSVGVVPVLAVQRARIESVKVELKACGPMNVFARHRTFRCALERPLWIVAAPTPESVVIEGAHDDTHDDVRTRLPDPHSVRSVREYTPGDPMRLVHWPSTARRATLVVREHESATGPRVAIVVDLREGDLQRREATVRRAAGAVRSVLAQGAHCLLVTDRSVLEVTNWRDADRVLAEAGPSVPGVVDGEWQAVVLRS